MGKMIIPKLDLMMVRAREIAGVSKSKGEPFSFVQGVFSDDEGSMFNLVFDKVLMANEAVRTKVLVLRNVPVTVTLRFSPSGFLMRGFVVAIET